MSTLVNDVRLSLRSLMKDRGFTAVAVITVALGVGANTAVFTVVDAVLLKGLPYVESERLVALHETAADDAPGTYHQVSYPNFIDWQRDARAFDGMAAFSDFAYTVAVGDTLERVGGPRVSWNYFDVLGARALHGRTFSAADDLPQAAPVVVLSHALWERAFQRNASAVGQTVTLDGQAATIVGIMPADFTSPPDIRRLRDEAQLWVPIGRFGRPGELSTRAFGWIDPVFARLKAGWTVHQAQSEMSAVASRLEADFRSENRGRGVAVMSLRDLFFDPMRRVLAVLFGAVGCVLLIACVNIASLLLVRGSGRHREVALRVALGARRGRIIRMLLTESVVVSLLGGTAGLVAALWMIDALVALSPVEFPPFVRIAVDWRVLGFTFAVCLLSGVVFGVAPSLMASRTDVLGGLKVGAPGGAYARSPRVRLWLVSAEVAASVLLLIGAGLLLRTLDRLSAFDPGFRPQGLVTVRVWVPPDPMPGADATSRLAQFGGDLLAHVRSLPGVLDASISWDVPLGNRAVHGLVGVNGRDGEPVRARWHQVSPSHFRTLGISLLEGRDFDLTDTLGTRRVAVVSRSMADRAWPGVSPLHRELTFGANTYEVVGMVENVQHLWLFEPATAPPDVYFGFAQYPAREFAVVARLDGGAVPLVEQVRSAVKTLNPAAPVYEVRTGDDLFAGQTTRHRFAAALLVIFALVALALTIVGIYGVVAHTVVLETRALGIRMALGATRGQVLRLVVADGFGFVAAGLIAGTGAALLLTRLLGSLLHGVTPTDPATFGVVVAGFAATSVVAWLIPARRATAIDPAVALRAE